MGKIGDLWVRLGLKKDEFTAGLTNAEKETKTFSGKVKEYFNSVAAKAVAIAAAFAAVGRAIAEAARNIAGFERANSELAAVLGTNIAGVKELSDSAKELGRTSEFTASEVTSLQVALARLGFDTGQIQNMQKSVLNFALAMGTDLGSAAEFTGSALRAFGLQSTDTQRLLDVMSASTTKSALNFSKLQTSIATVAPIAKSFGLDVKETTAFLGVLANNGFDASSAATALRNILLNLADSNGKLSKGLGHTAKSFPEIIRAFEELRQKGIKVDEILEMTDKRSAAAAAALISMGDDVAKLKGELDNANGSLKQMADTMGDNLIGSVKAMQSAWEGLTLAFEGSKGPMKWVVDRLTDILNRLTDIVSGDKVTFLEALTGPIFGGAVVGGKKRKERENGVEQYDGPPQSAMDLLRKANAGNGTTTNSTIQLTEKELERLRKKQKQAYQEMQQAARAAAEEARAAADADEEMNRMADETYRKWRDASGLPPVQPFDNDMLRIMNANLKETIDYMEEMELLGPFLEKSLDECTSKAREGLWNMKDAAEELDKEIAENLVDAISSGLVGAFDALADVIGGGTDGGMEQVLKALVEPLAEMAIKTGTLVMMSGLAIDKLLNVLKFAGNPLGAVAAGAALVAVGVAAKAGLAAIGNHGNSGTGISSVSSSASPYGGATGVQSAELVVRVEGTVKGSDIILSGQNTLNNWNR